MLPVRLIAVVDTGTVDCCCWWSDLKLCTDLVTGLCETGWWTSLICCWFSWWSCLVRWVMRAYVRFVLSIPDSSPSTPSDLFDAGVWCYFGVNRRCQRCFVGVNGVWIGSESYGLRVLVKGLRIETCRLSGWYRDVVDCVREWFIDKKKGMRVGCLWCMWWFWHGLIAGNEFFCTFMRYWCGFVMYGTDWVRLRVGKKWWWKLLLLDI